MSHAEAFGHFRSFVVGLEKNTRALRCILEEGGHAETSPDPLKRKLTNGRKASGPAKLYTRCARALEAASPEATAKEIVSEVAHQEALLRGVEATMAMDRPINEVLAKYQAIVEYNQLAFTDLEERLSAYGYVPPATKSPSTGGGGGKHPSLRKGTSSSIDVAASAEKGQGSLSKEDGNGAAGMGTSNSIIDGDDHQQSTDRDQGSVLDDNAASDEGNDRAEQGTETQSQFHASAGDRDGAGADDGGGDECANAAREEVPVERIESKVGDADRQEGPHLDAEGGDIGASDHADVATPARPSFDDSGEGDAAVEEVESDMDSPATPTLADWEISEETREMLRRDQAKQLHEQDRQKTPRGTGRNSIPSIATSTARSLAAMLADESVVNPGSDPDGEGAHDCASDDGCVGTRRHSGPARSSVSSSWSPPHLPHTPESSATRGGESTDQSQGAEGVIEASVGRDTWEEVNARGISMSASSPWQSDPPTPRMPSLEGREAWTPTSDRRASSSARYSEDRFCSVETPRPALVSPMQTLMDRTPTETANSSGVQPDTTPRVGGGRTDVEGPGARSPWRDASGSKELVREGESPTQTSCVRTPGDPPIQGESDGSPLDGELSTGPQDAFWGGESPASPVAPAQEAASGDFSEGRVRLSPSPPIKEHDESSSPETPCTPPPLSPHSGNDGGGVVGNSADPVSGRSSRSNGRNSAWIPEGASGHVIDRWNAHESESNLDGTGACDSDLGLQGDDRDGLRSPSDAAIGGDGNEDDECRTPELSSPARGDVYGDDSGDRSAAFDSAGVESTSAALCRRRLEEEEMKDGPLELVSEEEYSRAPTFLTIQVSRAVLNEAIGKLNAYASPRMASPSELLLTVDEITAIIDQGPLSRTLLLSAAHLKRVEMKGSRMYRIRGDAG